MALALLVLTVHLVFPVVALLHLWRARPASRLRGLHRALAAAGLVVMPVVFSPWAFLGFPLRFALLLGLGAALVVLHRRLRVLPWRGGRMGWDGAARALVWSAAGAGAWALALWAMAGHRAPPGGVDLAFPLRGGTFVVGQGGSTAVLNHHLSHPSQRYALDVARLNPLGLRAWGLFPDRLDRYAIFGAQVVSPCDGTVADARDGLPDLVPPERDRERVAGNFIALECGDATVYLAHLRRGSVRVKAGDRVRVGEEIARVGNSGNTTEPHLHVHAEAGPYPGEFSGRPGVPMRFEGRFLARNDLVRTGR